MSEGVPEKLSANNLSSHLSNSNLYVNNNVSQYEELQGLSLISKFEKSIQVLDFVLTCFATSNSNLYVNKDVSQYEGLQGLSLISKFEKSIQVLDFVLTCFATSPLSPLIMNLSRRAEECTYKWFF